MARNIWITGASSGIGEQLALQYAGNGDHIILTSRNVKKLESVRDASHQAEKVTLMPFDLSDYHKIPDLTAKVLEEVGHVDILINNAGISQRSLAVDTKFEVYERIMAINYFAVVALTQSLLPHFVERNRGNIATLSSVAGKVGAKLRTAYCSSKHALHGYFDALRAELSKTNIKITLICPGYVKTNISVNALSGDGSSFNKMDADIGKGLDAADLARWIIRDIDQGKLESVYGGKTEVSATYLKRFAPKLLAKMMANVETK